MVGPFQDAAFALAKSTIDKPVGLNPHFAIIINAFQIYTEPVKTKHGYS